MMSNRDSLRKFFAWTLVFLYQGFVSDAYAPPFYAINKDLESGVKAELPEGNNSIDYVTDQDIITQVQQSGFSESQEAASVITLCPDGQYVAACGNYRVGFNWLYIYLVLNRGQPISRPRRISHVLHLLHSSSAHYHSLCILPNTKHALHHLLHQIYTIHYCHTLCATAY